MRDVAAAEAKTPGLCRSVTSDVSRNAVVSEDDIVAQLATNSEPRPGRRVSLIEALEALGGISAAIMRVDLGAQWFCIIMAVSTWI